MSTLYAYFVRGATHAALCATSIESVRRADPYARFAVFTDDATALIGNPAKVQRYDFAGGEPIMLANLEAQCQTLCSVSVAQERVVFLDTDILMLKPLPWSGQEDLIVTWRDHVNIDKDGEPVVGLAVTMPYNYGVLGALTGPATIEAFIWMRERIRRMNASLKSWYGNQVALAALCGPRPQEGVARDVRRIPWLPTHQGREVRIMKLPGVRWNHTPRSETALQDAHAVLHFKGGARVRMEVYARELGLPWYLDERAAA